MDKVRVNTYTSIDEFKVAVEMQKELNKIKATQNAEPKPAEKPKPAFLGIDMSRENAQAFASDIMQYIEKEEFDLRALDDDRFKRDNELVKDSAIPGDVVILRNNDGRCC